MNELLKKKSDPDDPVGMVNLGNTCYLNSLLQILLHSPCFVRKIIHLNLQNLSLERDPESDTNPQTRDSDFTENGLNLLKELQKLFALMLSGNQNRVNPESLLPFLMDKRNNKVIEIGLQRDLLEFLDIFFECLFVGFDFAKEVRTRRSNRSARTRP